MSRVFIIAEAGVNHNGDIKIAKRLIRRSSWGRGGRSQSFRPLRSENLVCKTAQKAEYQMKTTNQSETQYDMLKKLELTEQMHKELMEYCMKKKYPVSINTV